MPGRKEEDIMIDNYIKSKIRSFNESSEDYYIEPSEDFLRRVMLCAVKCEKRRTAYNNILLIALVLSPFALREFWMLIRNDYFSMSAIPLGNFISSIYGFLISTTGFYTLLAIGIFGVVTIWAKRWKTMKFIIKDIPKY